MEKTAAKPLSKHPYEVLAARIRFYKFVALFLLVAFLLGGLLLLGEEFTAENIRYLIKDLNLSSPSLGLEASGISFDYDSTLTPALYREDLALLRRSTLEVYSFSGERTLSEQIAFSNPVLVTGEKYLLAYDLGGTKATICNSFSRLWHETYDYPIFCADLADDGSFAVVTSEKGYHSALYAYNSSFEKVFRWASADKLVSDVSYCAGNPNRIALSTVRSENGDYLCEVLLFDLSSDKVQNSFTVLSEMPLEVHYEAENRVILLTDEGLHLFTPSDGTVRTEAFSSEDLASFYTTGGYDILLKNSAVIGTALDITVYTEGEELLTFSVPTQILDAEVRDDTLYLLSYGTLYVYKLQSQTLSSHEVESEFKKLLPLNSGRIAFVGEGSVSVYMVG